MSRENLDIFADEKREQQALADQRLMAAIRKLRDALGMKQAEFAGTIGKSIPTVQRYEGVKPPKGSELLPMVKLARELGDREILKEFGNAIFREIPTAYWSLVQEIGYVQQAYTRSEVATESDSTKFTSAEREFIAPLLAMFRANDGRIKLIQHQIDGWKYEQKQRAEKKRKPKSNSETKWKKGSRHAG